MDASHQTIYFSEPIDLSEFIRFQKSGILCEVINMIENKLRFKYNIMQYYDKSGLHILNSSFFTLTIRFWWTNESKNSFSHEG